MVEMKVLVTGSAGFVGKNIFRYFSSQGYEVHGVSRRNSETTTYQIDLSDRDSLSLLRKINPSVIIHTAATTAVDYCEGHQEEAWKNNVTSTNNLVDLAAENQRKMVFISSDYVYPGETNSYDESSEERPINYYGKTKLEAEKLVSKLERHAILRPTVIFGKDPKGLNFLMQILRTNEKRRIPYDQISNPTSIEILLKYVEGVLKADLEGVFVATGPESMGRMEFTSVIASVFGIDETFFDPVKTSQLNQLARRPLNNGTNSSKIRKLLNYDCPSVLESLRKIKNGR